MDARHHETIAAINDVPERIGVSPFLSTLPAGRNEIRLAHAAMLVCTIAFAIAAPFAKVPLARVDAFIPAYESALVVNDLITAVLLLGQFRILRSKALWVLASGYLFTAFITLSHALTFPGLFAPSGLLGAGPQSTAWLYAFWHGGFAFVVIVYTQFEKKTTETPPWRGRPSVAVLSAIALVMAAVGGLTLLVTAGQNELPDLLLSNKHYTPVGITIFTSTWIFSVIALAALWRRRPHTVLDLWLMVVMCAWIFDIALSAVLNESRFDLGFYAGRLFGLLATSFVLMVLLLENGRLYFRLVSAHEGERKKAADLERLNVQIKQRVEERTLALEALHAKEEELRAILDNLYDCVITIDCHGIVRGANPAVNKVLGYAVHDLVGKNVSMIMPEPHRSAHDGYLDNFRRTGTPRIIGIGREIEGLKRNGERIALDLAVSEYRVHGQRYFVGTLRDIRERKRFIAELTQARADAEQANRAKDSFLATMSHEIRTPLTGMLGMLELLSMTRLESEQMETLDTAWSSARGLLRIVNDILDWSKIAEGKLKLALQATSIPHLLQEVVNTYSRVASAKSLILSQCPDTRLSAAHIVDPLRLSQVLNNFVSNAIKFTRQGSIEVRADLLDRVDSGERIRFSVTDTGIGITKEVQKQLFQRYRQGEADTARMYGGTGLGLAICRRLAEMMDGQVDLASEPGQGSTFSITLSLPVSAQPETLPLGSHPEVEQRAVTPLFDGSGDAPIVLAVDDHPINRNLLARQLTLLGLRVETAEDGQMALSMWQDGHFAVVITDCHMPEMDGYSLARAIRENEAGEACSPIPIIAWTANALAEECTKCQAAGMDGLLVKPNSLAQLKEVLAKCLSIPESDNRQSATAAYDANADTHSTPIDFSVLRQVVPDRAVHAQVLQDFQRHIQTDCAKLLDLLAQGDLAKVEITAHRMKGSSRMVGANSLAKACAALEAAARNRELSNMGPLRIALTEAVGSVNAWLEESSKFVDRNGEPPHVAS